MIDLFYWFDKSTKRKSNLSEYCGFCDVTYRDVIKHVHTRWLSLETAVTRALQQYSALRSYFLSEGITIIILLMLCTVLCLFILDPESLARFERLKAAFSKPITEIYFLFFQAALQCFLRLNKFLQREDPQIHTIYGQIHSFVTKLAGKFLRVSAIKDAGDDVCGLANSYREKQLPG